MRSDNIKFNRNFVRITLTSSNALAAKHTEYAEQSLEGPLVSTVFDESPQVECPVGGTNTQLAEDQANYLVGVIASFEKAFSCNLVILLDEYEFSTAYEEKAVDRYSSMDLFAFATYTVTAEWGVISDTTDVAIPYDPKFASLFEEIENDVIWCSKKHVCQPVPKGDMFLSPKACGLLIHEFIGHMLEEDNYCHSPFSINKSLKLPSTLSVLENYQPQSLYDDMGFEIVKALELVRRGQVVSLLGEGNYRKGAIHRHPIPRMRDMLIQPGGLSELDAQLSIEDGVCVDKIDSGEMNHLTGDFSVIVSRSRRIVEGKTKDPLPKFALFFSVESFCNAEISFCSELYRTTTLCGKEGSFVPIVIRSPACCIREFERMSHHG